MGTPTIELPAHQPAIDTLPNGLQTLIKPDPDAPVVSVQIWVRTGSIHEGKWLGGGISHLLEHMLFKGTKRRGPQAIPEEVQAIGGYINAYTSFDRTVYWIEAPPEGLETAIDILGDMAFHSLLPEDEFVKELDVIRREMAMADDSPSQVCSKRLFTTAFHTHPCRFPVIGHREVFDQITRPDLEAYYRRHYTPNNLFAVVAGPVDVEQTQQLLAKSFGAARREPQPPPVIPTEPRMHGRRESHHVGKTQLTHLRLAWLAPAVTDLDTGALDLLSTILGSGRSSRLYQRVRETGLVHSISAYLYSMADTGLFIIGADVDPDKRAQAEAAIFEVLAEVVRDGVTEAELSKGLKSSLSESLSQLTTTRGQASDIGSSWLLTANADFTRDYLAAVQKISTEQIREAALRWLNPDNVAIVSLNPEGSLDSKAKAAKSTVKRTTERIELESGLTLLVRPDPRLPLVTVHAAFRGGLLAETAKTSGITRFFSRLLTRDTDSRDAATVAETIEAVGGSFSSFSGYSSFGLSAEVMTPDWRLGLEAVAHALTQPKFAAGSLEREREFQLASIKAEKDRPMTVAAQKMREALFGKHPYRLPLLGDEKSVAAFDRAALTDFQSKTLFGGNGVLAVYGDVDISEVRESAEQLLDSLPAGERRGRKVQTPPPLAAAVRIEEEHDKEQAVVLIGFPTEGLYSEDAMKLELIDEACGDMSSRLFGKIREELGLAYMVGCSRVLGLAGGCFYFYVSTAPDKVAIVEEALRSEIAHLAKNGLDQAEFDRAKRAWQGGHMNQLQSLASRTRVNTLDELYDLGWNHCEETPAEMEAITREQIHDVAERHFLDRPDVFVSLVTRT